MKTEIQRKFLEINSIKDLLGALPPNESCKINLIDPPELKEHFFTESRSKCLELKEVAEENSNAYYECAKVNAVIKGKKIVSVIEELEVLE